VAQQYGGSGGGLLVTDPVRPPKRGKGPFVLLGVLVVLVLVGSALVVLHLRDAGDNHAGPLVRHTVTVGPSGTPNSGSSSPITTPSQTPTHASTVPAGPQGTVVAFFQAVNSHDYRQAWNLNTSAHSISDFQQFKQGYAQTSHDTVTITSVSGDTVYINLVAAQTDGTTKTFSGHYVVENGTIVQSSIQQTG
jgi:hypothetical protein